MGQFDGVVVWAGVSKKKFAQKNEQKISLYIMGQFDGVVVWAGLGKWFFFEKQISSKISLCNGCYSKCIGTLYRVLYTVMY